MGKDKKKKKPRVTYIDDGRSLADMSAFGGGRPGLTSGARGGLKDQAHTFFGAMRMMVKPMLVTMAIITAAFFLMWLLLKLSLL